MTKIFLPFITFAIFAGVAFFPTQLDKRIPFIIGAFALLLLPTFIRNLKQDIAKGTKTTAFFLLFLIASTISTLFSTDFERSLPMLLVYHACFIVFTSARSIFPTQKSKELFVSCFLFVVSILSLISLYHTLILRYVNRATEGVSFMWIYFGHNHLAALLLFAIPLSFYVFAKQKGKVQRASNQVFVIASLVGSYLFLLAFFFTFGFTSMISLTLATGITLLAFSTLTTQRKILVGVFLLGILSLFLLGTFVLPQRIGFAKYHESSANARFTYWQQAIDNAGKKPLTGFGLDTFRVTEKGAKFRSFYTHNFFLQMLSDTGVLGVISSIGLIGSVLWQSVKKLLVRSQKLAVNERFLHIALLIGLLASTLASMVDFDWQLPTVFFLFWIFAGFLRNAD